MAGVSGKTVIILGASGGIGKVLAQRFAREGAKVMVAGRNVEILKSLAADIDGDYTRCDITQQKDIEEMVAYTVERFGHIDVAINATGFGLLKPFLDTTPEELKQMAAVQFIGPFQLADRVGAEQDEESGGIGAVLLNNGLGNYYITQTFRHLG